MGTDALFTGSHQMRRLKPEMQFDLAILENGAHFDRKFALAGAATAQANATTFHVRNSVRATTARAMRALGPNDCL
jgi:hypothetical protein